MYQFAAMIGLPRGLTLFDFGFSLIFEIEDLFFFFCSSRPMIVTVVAFAVAVILIWKLEMVLVKFS